MDFSDVTKRVKQLQRKFPRQYDQKTQLINLMEEVGELANAALVELGEKPEKRRFAHLNDSFADVLFALMATAESFSVDLEAVFLQALDEIEARLQEGAYHE